MIQKIKKKTHLPGVDLRHQQREPLDDLLTHRDGGQQEKETSYGIFGHPAEEQITPTYTDDRASTLTTWSLHPGFPMADLEKNVLDLLSKDVLDLV